MKAAVGFTLFVFVAILLVSFYFKPLERFSVSQPDKPVDLLSQVETAIRDELKPVVLADRDTLSPGLGQGKWFRSGSTPYGSMQPQKPDEDVKKPCPQRVNVVIDPYDDGFEKSPVDMSQYIRRENVYGLA